MKTSGAQFILDVIPRESPVFDVTGKRRSEQSEDELELLEATCSDYWNRSRDLESETVVDLEKHLWLANAAAATASIALIQAKTAVSLWQYLGAWSFIAGILALVVMKFVSAINSSRDRSRFQDAKSRFDVEEVTDDVFRTIRDSWFGRLKKLYLVLQWGSGGLFISGLILTLVGVRCAV